MQDELNKAKVKDDERESTINCEHRDDIYLKTRKDGRLLQRSVLVCLLYILQRQEDTKSKCLKDKEDADESRQSKKKEDRLPVDGLKADEGGEQSEDADSNEHIRKVSPAPGCRLGRQRINDLFRNVFSLTPR